MGLFTKAQVDAINKVAEKSTAVLEPVKNTNPSKMSQEINEMSQRVVEYFKDSPAILISNVEELHDYITEAIKVGYVGIDTETTGLDRVKDCVVGASLYYPGGVECYIPMKHIVPLFEQPYKDQLTYEEVGVEFQRFVDSKSKMIFANADYDLSMIYKDLKVNMNSICYFDVILAWRCLKENEQHNDLKSLYNKYCLKGSGDPMKFKDFFTPTLFPYCKPKVAKLYAANDAKITYELFKFELQYLMTDNPKCIKNNLEKISELVWNVEFPLIDICQNMHRFGIYLDKYTGNMLKERYSEIYKEEFAKLANMIDDVIEQADYAIASKRPFVSGNDFNVNSPPHTKYLVYDMLKIPADAGGKKGTGKEVLTDLNLPITNQILKIRSLLVLINTFVEKLPKATTSDSRIHAQFKQMGASTGRMSCISKGTMIDVLNGKKPIEEIEPGDLVYCYDDLGELHLAKVKNRWLTGHRECVEIRWQSSGTGKMGSLICTPEHPIRLKTGEWKHAEDLKRFDKVAHLYRSDGKGTDRRPIFYGWNGVCIREQDLVRDQLFGKPASEGWVIHHKNEITDDNRLENLEVMQVKDHLSHHSKVNHSRGILKPISYYHDRPRPSNEGSNNPNYRPMNSSELIDMIEFCEGRLGNVPMDFGTFKIKCRENGVDFIEIAKKYNPQYYKNRPTITQFLDAYEEYQGDEKVIREVLNIPSDYRYRSYLNDCGIAVNHMVQSVKPVGSYDVYDIEVEGFHNFIANEINVHNSAEPNMQNIPSHAEDIRHMFRATPLSYHDIPCEKFENILKFRLPDNYKVVIEGRDFQFIEEAELGTSILLKNGNQEVYVELKSKEHFDTSYILSFKTPEDPKYVANWILPSHEPAYIMLSSDYSQQEPKILAYVSADKSMCTAFQQGKDIYATIASLAFNVPYEKCLEFHPETGEYQPDGKERRGQAKFIVLGVSYGRSVAAVGEQLFGTREDMTDEEKTKEAQKVFDAVFNAFPNLRSLMISSQKKASELGYTETILGRRRHHPDMQLPEFEFKPMKGYVNPDIDPLNPATLQNKSEIPQRVVDALLDEFSQYKYFGQIAKRTKALYNEENIKVINNRPKINEASRAVVNSIIQGSAADLTKLAVLRLDNDKDWQRIKGRLLVPVHDELICEVPIEYAKEGGEILSRCMSEAGGFLPFTINCDVTTTHRWYGLEYPCQYKEATSINTEDEDEIKWIQYHLVEQEYILPTFRDENGDKPRGDAAKGVNGKRTPELESAIFDYINRKEISPDDFISYIRDTVKYGRIPI